MNTIRFALTTSALTLVAAPAFAQTDDCTAPTAINTTGTFNYDTTSNTASGFSTCGATFNEDAFWVWTCPADGDYSFDTCGTNYDTRIGVNTGADCTATCIAQNDDFCGLQSSVSVSGLLAGDQVLIQVGGFSAGNVGPGVMNINTIVGCTGQTDDALEENDTCLTAVPGPPNGVTAGLFADLVDPDFYSYVMNAGDILDFSFIEGDPTSDLDLRLYDGSCVLIQNFNTDGLSYVAAAAQTVIVEVYVDPAFPGPGCTTYDATVSLAPDPCLSLPADGLEDNDFCSTALPITDGTYPALSVFKTDWDYYSCSLAAGATLTADMFFSHANGDLDIFLYDAATVNCQTNENVQTHGTAGSLASGFSASDNESVVYTNATGACQDIIIEVNVWGATASDCNSYDLVLSGITGCGGTITIDCDPANPHTQGGPVELNSSSFGGTGSGLHVEATGGPAGEFGYLLVAASLNNPGSNVSNGILCLAAPIGRYAPAAGAALNSVGDFNAAGTWQTPPGSGTTGWDVPVTLPSPPDGSIASGDTWYFQLWYRDGQRSNFSNAICVTFP